MTLFGDIFFINKVPFFAIISDHIKFTTTEHIANHKLKQLVLASLHVQAIYAARDFNVKVMIMDGEFVPLKHDLAIAGIFLNTTAANEHVPKIERLIRVIKEREHATRHTLSFKEIPLVMLVNLVYSTTIWLNAFPPKGGISSHLSPRNIITDITFNYNKYCRAQFGSYVQTHEEPESSSMMQAHTLDAICLGPTGNLQGSYKFLNLRTGRRITLQK